jgi:ABC-type sugar transport system ATPase subunit
LSPASPPERRKADGLAGITLDRISKQYAGGHHAVRDGHLEIRDGEFVVLVGPSGCGKSTMLRLIAGLETPTSGRVLLDGRDVTTVPPQDRDVAMVFQSYALYPHLSVRDNLAYGLKVRRLAGAEIDARLRRVADALELGALLDRRPSQLSGGQRQRVALGRAMVREPQAFLFDEPLSNLDPALRTSSRAELLRLHQRLKTTMVYVTHDQEEAMTLADRVAVMRAGVIEQFAPPLDLYAQPVNTFVAQFMGSPPMNLFSSSVLESASAATTVGVRPHDILIDSGGVLDVIVDLVEPRGHDAVLHLRLDGFGIGTDPVPAMVAVVPIQHVPSLGDRVRIAFRAGSLRYFDGDGRALA